LAAELDMTPEKIIEVQQYGEPIRPHLVNNDTGRRSSGRAGRNGDDMAWPGNVSIVLRPVAPRAW
jgi:hypothetical protein